MGNHGVYDREVFRGELLAFQKAFRLGVTALAAALTCSRSSLAGWLKPQGQCPNNQVMDRVRSAMEEYKREHPAASRGTRARNDAGIAGKSVAGAALNAASAALNSLGEGLDALRARADAGDSGKDLMEMLRRSARRLGEIADSIR